MQHNVGLIAFDHTIEEVCPVTESWLKFVTSLSSVEPGGSTYLWEAITEALAMLLEYQADHDPAKACKLRILVLTDGMDTTHTSPGQLIEDLKVGGGASKRIIRVARHDSCALLAWTTAPVSACAQLLRSSPPHFASTRSRACRR